MKQDIYNLIKLLLSLHKELLDLERARYEKKNGAILNNNEYFNIVINHDDFKWLRALSEVIALIDEESEVEPINQNKINQLLMDLLKMISENDKSEFSIKYNQELARGFIADINNQVKVAISGILN
jgi:hypothetical protein